MNIEVNVEDRVLRPVHEVFTALVDPTHMAQYFISRSSGPLKAGSTVTWEFADVDAKVDVEVLEVALDRRLVFVWSASGTRTRVTIGLKPVEANNTLVIVNEAGWPLKREGVQRALGQNAGWTYALCCLKAYLQFGINLRQGVAQRLTEVQEDQAERHEYAA